MADETEIQNTGSEAGSEQSQEDVTLDSFLGTETAVETTERQTKETTDTRDFKKWAEKERARADKLEAELQSLKSQKEQKSEFNPEEAENDPGVKFFLDKIDERISQRIQPLTQVQQREQQEKVLSEYNQDPIFRTLNREISKAYESLPKTGNFKQDLDFAFNYTKGKYQDDIARANREVGQEEGFKGRVLKQSGGMTGRPTVPQLKDDFEKRYYEGNLSTQEFKENQARIREIDRRDREEKR